MVEMYVLVKLYCPVMLLLYGVAQHKPILRCKLFFVFNNNNKTLFQCPRLFNFYS